LGILFPLAAAAIRAQRGDIGKEEKEEEKRRKGGAGHRCRHFEEGTALQYPEPSTTRRRRRRRSPPPRWHPIR